MVALMQHLESRGFSLLDVQLPTDHLASMGAVAIGRDGYLARLREAIASEATFAG
jgi:leucyl/phenylalanyl-tRNA--protein transferase